MLRLSKLALDTSSLSFPPSTTLRLSRVQLLSTDCMGDEALGITICLPEGAFGNGGDP